MKKEKYLPIGSVVLLDEAKKRVMITGFAAKGKETGDELFDYMGCIYPEGIISSEQNLLFNHDQIKDVYYIGYIDNEWRELEPKLKDIVEKINNGELSLELNDDEEE